MKPDIGKLYKFTRSYGNHKTGDIIFFYDIEKTTFFSHREKIVKILRDVPDESKAYSQLYYPINDYEPNDNNKSYLGWSLFYIFTDSETKTQQHSWIFLLIEPHEDDQVVLNSSILKIIEPVY